MEKYRNPIWQDKKKRHVVCEMLQGDGEYVVAHVIAGPESEGGVNEDYNAIVEEFGIDGLNTRTEVHKNNQKKQALRKREQEEQKFQRQKQEILFNMKLEIFEIDLVKQSKNKTLKKLIRKAKSPIEAQAYATILMQSEYAADVE